MLTSSISLQDHRNIDRSKASTRLALLGTMGHLHSEPMRCDLARLLSLLDTLEPDLLGVAVDPNGWEQGKLSGAPIEVQEALVPEARRVGAAIVPLTGPSPLEFARPAGKELARLRASQGRAADNLLRRLQRAADSPGRVNSTLLEHVCALICHLGAAATSDAGRRSWKETNDRILDWLVWAVRRDPGRRVLVAVQCRRVHWLAPRLKRVPDIELVSYRELWGDSGNRRQIGLGRSMKTMLEDYW